MRCVFAVCVFGLVCAEVIMVCAVSADSLRLSATCTYAKGRSVTHSSAWLRSTMKSLFTRQLCQGTQTRCWTSWTHTKSFAAACSVSTAWYVHHPCQCVRSVERRPPFFFALSLLVGLRHPALLCVCVCVYVFHCFPPILRPLGPSPSSLGSSRVLLLSLLCARVIMHT
jgi:hypothetical protein